MFNLPFLRKDAPETQKYVFMLFLAGNRVYGFAFEENNQKNRSALYQEPVDPFLKNAVEKVEKIIGNCEHDLGENAYLKKTVLVLNSFYTTDSGAIKENFFQDIKNLLKRVDLVNLGYLNFYEVVVHNYNDFKHYFYLEESLYDYTLYEISQQKIKKTQKIPKAPNPIDTLKELKKHLQPELKLIAWLEKQWQHQDLEINHHVTEANLVEDLIKIYFKDKQTPTVDEKSVDEKYKELALAPGFTHEAQTNEAPAPEAKAFVGEPDFAEASLPISPSKPKLVLPKINWHLLIAKIPKRSLIVLVPIIFLITFIIYLLFFHRAVIFLETKKENFSSNIEFEVSAKSDFIKAFQTTVSLTASQATTGEKVTGEKAKGEVTIYNGLFEKKDLSAGFVFESNNGISFVLNEAVSVPAATTSADLDEGLITTAFGKKNASVTAAGIGAEGNLDSGVKLFTDTYSADEFYALTNNDFSGGVKKTVAVFANKDAVSLEKKALTLSKNKLVNEFSKLHNQDILFSETISTTGVNKEFSAEIDEEANRVSLKYNGLVKAFYAPYEQLVNRVQQQKLKDKEFVEQTFTLKKVKLLDKEDNLYTYSAIVSGQVQNLLDKEGLLKQLSGKLTGSAQNILEQQLPITNYSVLTKPLPLPILPWNTEAIKFEFEL